MPYKRKDGERMTTLWISESTKQSLSQKGLKKESWDATLRRMLSGIAEVKIDFLAVDGDSPYKHLIIFSLGDFYYLWDKGIIVEVDKTKISAVLAK